MRRAHPRGSLVRATIPCLLLSIVWATSGQAITIAGPVINPANGHLYYVLDTASWTDSEAEATTLGGHLVTINDAAENDWVFDNIVPLLPTDVASTPWLGLNDAALEGTFVWASGEPVTFTNWSPAQPDDARGVEDYAHMWTPLSALETPSVFGQWNDLSDDGFSVVPYGVVEVTPEPATFSLLGFGLIALLAIRWLSRLPKRV